MLTMQPLQRILPMGMDMPRPLNTWMPFNPEVTTGPTVILPGALLIGFFGSTYWVPAFTALILSLSLIFLICRVHLEYLEKDLIISGTQTTDWIYAVLILLFSSLVVDFRHK